MTSAGDIRVGVENRRGGKENGSRQFGGKGWTNFLKKHSHEMIISFRSLFSVSELMVLYMFNGFLISYFKYTVLVAFTKYPSI
jgi:hypothetical protein